MKTRAGKRRVILGNSQFEGTGQKVWWDTSPQTLLPHPQQQDMSPPQAPPEAALFPQNFLTEKKKMFFTLIQNPHSCSICSQHPVLVSSVLASMETQTAFHVTALRIFTAPPFPSAINCPSCDTGRNHSPFQSLSFRHVSIPMSLWGRNFVGEED